MLYHDPQAWIAQSKSHDRIVLEWIADSGAGRDLASNRAFIEQGVPGTVVQSCTQSISPIKFETGNGSYTADACVSLNGSAFGHANFSVMEDFPIVRFLGKIVSTGKPFVRLPDQLPFFCQDVEGIQLSYGSTKVHSASRVKDKVPIFSETFQMNDTFALPAEEIAPVEAPAIEVAAGDDHLGSDAGSEHVDEDPFPRAERLQAEARSVQHQMCHIPKNLYCPTCSRSMMYRRRVTRKTHDPLEARGDLEEVTEFGQRLASDFIIVSKSHKNDKESVVLVIRDEYSGYLAAYPCAKRTSEVIVKSMLAFLGPSFHAHPTIMCKTDNAPEFVSACTTLGFVHEPSLARRWPHNSVMEREIRTLEEVTRAAHLGAGFQLMLNLWQHIVFNMQRRSLMPIIRSKMEMVILTTDMPLPAENHLKVEIELVLGQLIYVRKDPLNRHKFEANAVPALFVRWRYDSGPKSHKGVYLTIDYSAMESQSPGYAVALSVPCEEVYVPPGDPIIPLQAAAEAALADFSDPSLAEYLPKEVPFSSLPSDAPPAVRHEYITLDRIIRFGATPDCKACSEMKGRHNSRCKARFDTLVKAEKAARTNKSPSTPADGRTSMDDKVEDAPIAVEVGEAASHPDDLPFSAGIPPAAVGKAVHLDQQFLGTARMRSRYRRLNHLPGHCFV